MTKDPVNRGYPALMSRRALGIALSALAVVVVIAVAFLFVVAPSGGETATDGTLDHVAGKADTGTAEVLARQDWGDGELVLVGYDRRGVRRLGIAFAAKQLRGWRVQSYTEEAIEPDDVVVGSLLVASSPGGEGQPAWSAAVGELLDKRIDRVEIRWTNGEKSYGSRNGDAYLVVERGETKALEARYLDDEGTEIATVPVSAKV
jgi:hypothetical protein